MVYYRGTGHADNAGALHIRFSDDYGETWTAEDTDLDGDPVVGMPMDVPDADPTTDANEPWLYLAPNGDLVVHMWCIDWTTLTYAGSYQSISSDGGKTWGAVAQTSIAGVADPTVVFTTDDHFVYDGVIYAGVSIKGTGEGIMKSEDNGATWTYIANVASGVSEIGIEYLGTSTIIAMLRDNGNTNTYRATSSDMGATWSAKEEITYHIPASGRHRIWTRARLEGSSATWWTDTQLVMCGFVFTGGNRRSCLWVSKDSGASWSAPLYVDDAYADGGYGDLFYNPNTGEYVFMCYRGTQFKADLVQYNISVDWGS